MNAKLEAAIGLLLLLAVAILFRETYNPIYEGFGQPDFPPMRFPRWMLLSIAALALLHLLRVTLGLVRSEPLFTRTRWIRTALAALVSLCGALLIDAIGFTFAAMLTFWTTGFVLGYRFYLRLTLYTVLFAIGTWALFTFVINIGLPTSPIFNRI